MYNPVGNNHRLPQDVKDESFVERKHNKNICIRTNRQTTSQVEKFYFAFTTEQILLRSISIVTSSVPFNKDRGKYPLFGSKKSQSTDTLMQIQTFQRKVPLPP